MGANYNDAGARAKTANAIQKEAANLASSGQRMIDSNADYLPHGKYIQQLIASDPKLAAAFKVLSGHVMLPELLGGMDAAKAFETSPEGSGEGKAMKIRSIEDLRKASQILNGSDY